MDAQQLRHHHGISPALHEANTAVHKAKKKLKSLAGDGKEKGAKKTAFPDKENTIDKIVVSQLINRCRGDLLKKLTPQERSCSLTKQMVLDFVAEGGESDDKLASMLDKVRFDHLIASNFTVNDAFEYDCDGMSLLSWESVEKLRRLTTQVVVGKDQVKEILEADPVIGENEEEKEEALESIFQFESRVVPGSLLADFLIKMEQPVSKVRFSMNFVKDVLHSMRSLVTSVPYIALIITFFAFLGTIDLWSRYASFLNASTPEEPWSNFCHGDVVNGSCYFHKRNIEEAVSAEETLQFVQTEIVNDLWKYTNGSQGASQVPFEGSWLLGALIFRTSPPTGTDDTHGAPLHSCDSLNLTEYIVEPRMGHTFDCRYWNATVIPFSWSKADALAASSAYTLDVPVFSDASIIVQYAMLAPSTGNIVWVSIALSVPEFGGVVARIQTKIKDGTTLPIIQMAFWFSLVVWLVDVTSLVLLWRLKVGRWQALASVSFRTFLLALISVAYSLTTNVDVSGVLSDEYVIRGLDKAVNNSMQAEQLFGLWSLFLIVLLVQFIAFLDGFQIIVKLVVRIVPEILGLFFVFGFAYVMFVLMAMILFGQTNEKYCTFFNANAQLIQYFLLHFDLETLMENEPQSGFAFYYVFRIFLFYLVLNFFIVTVIAPIRSVWLEGDLPIAVNAMLEKLHGTSLIGRLRANAVRYGIMSLDLVVGFFPFSFSHWLSAYQWLGDLYDPQSPLSDLVESCNKILDLRSSPNLEPYLTDRGRTLPVLNLANYDASFVISLLLIVTESNNSWVRDARTMRLLSSFDEFQTSFENDLEAVEDEGEHVLPPEDISTFEEDSDLSSEEDEQQVYDGAHDHHAEDRKPESKDVNQLPPHLHLPQILHTDPSAPPSPTTDVKGNNSSENAGKKKSIISFSAESDPLAIRQRNSVLSARAEGRDEDFSQKAIEFQDIADKDIKFHFTRYLVESITEHRHFHDVFYVCFNFLNRLAILAIYLAMLVTVASTPRNIAYFSRNAHSGIRDLPYRQSCDDPLCESGFTKLWTYTDNKRLDHLRMFIDRRLVLSLYGHGSSTSSHKRRFSTLSYGGANTTTEETVVGWDHNIRLVSPVYVRQLRAVGIACSIPSPDATVPTLVSRYSTMQSTNCGAQLDFDQSPISVPSDTLLTSDDYQFHHSCPEIDEQPITGVHQRRIPCLGHVATIHNASQLHYAVNHWIDSQTRFVGISFTLAHGSPSHRTSTESIRLQYNLYAELSEGGSAGQFFTRTIPLSDANLDHVTDVCLWLFVVDFIFAVLEVTIPIAHCLWNNQQAHIKKLPMFSMRMVVFFLYLIGYLLREDHVSWPRLCISCLVVLWLTYEALFEVVFPFSQFFFRRVTIVNHFIRLTFVKVTLLIPVFAIILSSFAISGYLLWAGRLPAFATLHVSFFTISQGLLGDFEFSEMYAINASYAMIYMILFLIIVIIFLLNLLLAVIAGCADEAREESQMMAPIEVIGRVMHRRVYYGPIVGVLMMFLLDRQRVAKNTHDGEGDADVKSKGQPVENPLDQKLKKDAADKDQVVVASVDSLPNEVSSGMFNKVEFSVVSQKQDSVVSEHREGLTSVPSFGAPPPPPPSAAPAQGEGTHSTGLTFALPPVVLTTLSSSELLHHRKSVVNPLTKVETSVWNVIGQMLFEVSKRGRREKPRIHILEHARLPTPLECLLPRLGPVLLAEVSHTLHISHQPEAMQCSFVAYILAMHQHFQAEHPGQFAQDVRLDEEKQIEVLGALHLSRAMHPVNHVLSNHHLPHRRGSNAGSPKGLSLDGPAVAGTSHNLAPTPMKNELSVEDVHEGSYPGRSPALSSFAVPSDGINHSGSMSGSLMGSLKRAAKRGKNRLDVFEKQQHQQQNHLARTNSRASISNSAIGS